MRAHGWEERSWRRCWEEASSRRRWRRSSFFQKIENEVAFSIFLTYLFEAWRIRKKVVVFVALFSSALLLLLSLPLSRERHLSFPQTHSALGENRGGKKGRQQREREGFCSLLSGLENRKKSSISSSSFPFLFPRDAGRAAVCPRRREALGSHSRCDVIRRRIRRRRK